jgi:hypothetical protein
MAPATMMNSKPKAPTRPRDGRCVTSTAIAKATTPIKARKTLSRCAPCPHAVHAV